MDLLCTLIKDVIYLNVDPSSSYALVVNANTVPDKPLVMPLGHNK
jgi:hypothetical protein